MTHIPKPMGLVSTTRNEKKKELKTDPKTVQFISDVYVFLLFYKQDTLLTVCPPNIEALPRWDFLLKISI